MKISTRYFAIIGVAVFAYIISTSDSSRIIRVLAGADIRYLLIAIILAGITVILKSMKWNYVMKKHNIKIGLSKATKIWLIGSFVGSLTPGRAGEIIKVYYLKDKYPSGVILSTIAIDRISDVLSLFLFNILGISVLLLFFKINLTYIIWIIVLATLLAYLLTKENFVRTIAKPAYKHFIPDSKKKHLKISYQNFFMSLASFKKDRKVLAYTLLQTAIIWLVGITQAYMLTLSLGLNVPYLYLFSVAPIFMLTMVLPITIAGVGTREAAFIFFFSLIGIGNSDTISYTLLELGLILLMTALGAAIWLFDRKKISI